MATKLTRYLEIPLQEETVDGSVEIADVLGERAAMTLLPTGDCTGLAAVPPLDPHVFHAWCTFEDLNHAECQVLVERILGDNVHEERHRLEFFALRHLFANSTMFELRISPPQNEKCNFTRF